MNVKWLQSACKNWGQKELSREMFLGKGVLKICSKSTAEHPCRSVISIKLLCNVIEITLQHGCSPVNLLHIFSFVFAIFYHFFIFSPNESPLKTWKMFSISSKKLFSPSTYSNFCNFFPSFPHFRDSKPQWKWNNLWCHQLTCINLQM